MNLTALYHRSDSEYCFAVDQQTVVLRLRAARGERIIGAEVFYNNKYDIFKKQFRAEMRLVRSDLLFDWYEARLRLCDPRLCYYFCISCEEQQLYYSENGVEQEYDIGNSHFSAFQLPYLSPGDIHRLVPWADGAVFYQIFVDRFAVGNPQKDASYINLKWGDIPNPKSFAGGDLRGITENLGYIKGLGANALYLTPIFLSPSNHKYDTVDYLTIDPQFGTGENLKELVDSSHKLGIKVVLDGVFNHISSRSVQFRHALKHGAESPYFDWFKFKDGGYETFARCEYMPKINTENPEARDYLIRVGLKYVREFDIDGWRLDVADEISHSFLRDFRRAVKSEKPDCLIIGEDWHDSRSYLMGDQFDGVMNYPFTKACLDMFGFSRLTPRQFACRLNELLMRNSENASRMAFNLLDSHDTDRFFTDTGCNVSATLAAWAVAALYPGSLCIFYGDELPTEGGYDPDCRRTFDRRLADAGFNRDFRNIIAVRSLTELKSPDVSIWESGGVVYIRRGEVSLAVNCGSEPAAVQPDGRSITSRLYEDGTLDRFGYIITRKEK